MHSLFFTITLAGGAVFSLGTGIGALAQPAQFGRLLGYESIGSSGLNEIRSQYGGFFLVAGLLMATAVAGWTPPVWSFVFATVLFGGLFLGRLVSLPLDAGAPGYVPAIRLLHFVDATCLTLSLAGLWMTLH